MCVHIPKDEVLAENGRSKSFNATQRFRLIILSVKVTDSAKNFQAP